MKPLKSRDQVERLLESWARRFYLAGYCFDIVFEDEDEAKPSDANDDWNPAYMMIEGQSEYKRAYVLHVYPRYLTDCKDRDEQDRHAAHEMAHVISDPLVRLIDHLRNGRLVTEREAVEAQEEVADWIASVVVSEASGASGTSRE